MNESIGTRWQPGQDLQMGGGRPQGGPTTQSATPAKLLSLRLPNRQGQSAVAPNALLQGQGGQSGGGNLAQFLTLLSHLLNNPQNAGGGYSAVDPGMESLGSDRDPVGGHGTQRVNIPGLQVPAQGPTQRIQPAPNNIPTPRFTIGQGAAPEDAPGFF